MIICEKCKGKKPLYSYNEKNTAAIPGLSKIRCDGCNAMIKGRFWIKATRPALIKAAA